MELIVAPLSRIDREEWESLYRGYAEFYEVPMSAAILARVWAWVFDPEQAFFCLMAKNTQGKGLGLMHYRAMHSPLRGAMVGFLDDLYVCPSVRGQGAVEALFAALEQEARAHAWPFVRWITADNNFRARAVYDKLAQKTHWLTYQKTLA